MNMEWIATRQFCAGSRAGMPRHVALYDGCILSIVGVKEEKIRELIVLLLIVLNAEAKDFGQMGNVFLIKEEGFLSMINARLKEVNIELEQEKMTQSVKEKIENPTPEGSVTKTLLSREFSFDPTCVLSEDVILPCGKVILKAGSKVNPLDHMDFDRVLFFVDSKDRSQIRWLKSQILNATKLVRVILVRGNPRKLAEELGINVYFDQFGELVQKFDIRHVPAFMEQDGRVMKITEVMCDE